MNREQFKDLEAIYFILSDYLLGLNYPKFAEEQGGIDKILEELMQLYENYELKYNTFEEDE